MAKQSIVFTNQVKYKRAVEIVEVLNGRAAKPDEVEAADSFAKICAENDIDPKKEEAAVKFVYEKLGGLVTTYEKIEARKAAAGRRNGVKSKKDKDEDEIVEGEEEAE